MNVNNLNIFGSALTRAAPASNYRGESEDNRTVLQSIPVRGVSHAVVAVPALKNGLRETVFPAKGLPTNRKRLHNEDQLAVKFEELPDKEKFADDFFCGYGVFDAEVAKTMRAAGRAAKQPAALLMNMAVATTPFKREALLHQSPKNVDSPWKNTEDSGLVHREVCFTAFQYSFCLHAEDCKAENQRAWARRLLGECLPELSNVAGGHALNYFEMAPDSVVLRITKELASGFSLYGFQPDGSFSDLSRINPDDLPGSEFWIGGGLVRQMTAEEKARLTGEGAHLFPNAKRALEAVAAVVFPEP